MVVLVEQHEKHHWLPKRELRNIKPRPQRPLLPHRRKQRVICGATKPKIPYLSCCYAVRYGKTACVATVCTGVKLPASLISAIPPEG